MSEPWRIAVAVEGPTDSIVLEAIVRSLLDGADQREDWECRSDPEGQLNALPKKKRFSKRKRDYLERGEKISQAWPRVSTTLTEATRFQEEFLRAIRDE